MNLVDIPHLRKPHENGFVIASPRNSYAAARYFIVEVRHLQNAALRCAV